MIVRLYPRQNVIHVSGANPLPCIARSYRMAEYALLRAAAGKTGSYEEMMAYAFGDADWPTSDWYCYFRNIGPIRYLIRHGISINARVARPAINTKGLRVFLHV